MKHRLIGTGDGRVSVFALGAGAPIILVPSPLILARTYGPLVRRLSETKQVVVIELPGSGASSRVAAPLSPRARADVIARVLDALAIDRAVVIGHSSSGAGVLAFGHRHPDRTRALVLADPTGVSPEATLAGVIAGRFLDSLLEPKLTVVATSHVLVNALRHRGAFFSEVLSAARPQIFELGAPPQVPLLFTWGRRDHALPPDQALAVLRSWPDVELELLAGSHDTLITRPRAFCDAVVRFLAKRAPD